ncbi:hypothetical protein QSJ19_14230 [Gordonia sp. ABSL11-1]|uniref:hypothetical protein n=1 Tax=Gordonia sp. ABSL11-1 TaxID=3053924 RepID=UPI0025726493|nr:hypothetical protein [Gordonia sp. ABSL11-1]MDL9946728.1 hypothetical protein [Gordonia sp. ABSL11-1]
MTATRDVMARPAATVARDVTARRAAMADVAGTVDSAVTAVRGRIDRQAAHGHRGVQVLRAVRTSPRCRSTSLRPISTPTSVVIC